MKKVISKNVVRNISELERQENKILSRCIKSDGTVEIITASGIIKYKLSEQKKHSIEQFIPDFFT